jgi:hypothetical protein
MSIDTDYSTREERNMLASGTKKSSVESSLDDLHRSIDSLAETLGILSQRLSLILLPEVSKPEPVGNEALPLMSPVAAALNEAIRRLRSQRRRVDDLLSRLET